MKNPCVRKRNLQGVLSFLFFSVFVLFFFQQGFAEDNLRVGVVFSGRLESYFRLNETFLKKLSSQEQHHNIEFIYQKPHPDSLAWANAIRKVLAYDTDLIITYGSGATEVALYEASGKPVIGVFVSEGSFDRKEYKKLALVQYRVPVLSIMRYLNDLTIDSRPGIIESSIEPSSSYEARLFNEFSSRVGHDSIRLTVNSSMDLNMRLKLYRYSCIVVTHSCLVIEKLKEKKYMNFILKEKVPVVSLLGENKAISVVSFEPDLEEMAEVMIKVFNSALKGQYISTTTHRLKITYNLKLSRQLNLPPSVKLITISDEVIK